MQVRVPVEEFTTPDPIIAETGTSIDEVWRLMDRHGVRHLPVVRDDEVVGVVSDRDVRVVLGLSAAEKLQVQAADVMSTDLVTVTNDTPLDEVAYLMSNKKVGSVLVKDQAGELVGIFTITDALNALIEIVRKGSPASK